MKRIEDYLNNFLDNKNKKILFKQGIIKIILNQTGIILKTIDINLNGSILNIKTKPAIKHKINLHKQEILNQIKKQFGLNIENIY